MDIGVHVLDLLHWWLGTPESVVYEDDAMGGVETNCRLRLQYADFGGEVRLSRDWPVPGGYEFTCQDGWIRWDGTPDRVTVQLRNGRYLLQGHLQESDSGLEAANFEQSFVAQLRNVVTAVHGGEPLHVPGAAALPSLQMVETCYAQRALMSMPWLSPAEQHAAQQQVEAAR
jgi:predicted dehydrogenase